LILPKDEEMTLPGHVIREESKIIRYKQVIFKLKNLPYGWYAIFVVHDRNENGKLDYMRLDKPREGFGASNNGVTNIGNLVFSKAKFEFKRDNMKLNIPMNYY
jgi:uncharacterized protein (DUF2141 family)